ncbi:MAG: porin [Verrucomicrobia bacterium]|nr:MAG: porin [Verrucomicrobiota bacterium]
MNKYIAEFIGTFFLVLTIGCTGIGASSGVIAPLAIGAVLMVMVFAGGHVSGAHYNPAVTLGVLIRGRLKVADVVPYIVAQLVAAATAAVAVKFLRAGIDITPIAPKIGPAQLAEFLFTFALVYVVLNAATAEGTSGNSFYGLAIGMTVMTGAFAVGDISGGAFNPAVALGISILGISTWDNLWIYLLANFAAAVVAAVVFNLINPPTQTTPIATDEKSTRKYRRRQIGAPTRESPLVSCYSKAGLASARQDHVLFCPTVDLAAMGTSEFSRFDLGCGPECFFDCLTGRR